MSTTNFEGGDTLCTWFENVVLGHFQDSNNNIPVSYTPFACTGPLPAPPVPAPTINVSYTAFLGCQPGCGYSPYLIEWSGSNASSYEVQSKIYGNWINHYTGTGTSTLGTSNGTSSPGYYRVRAVNAAGESDWSNHTLWVQCSSTQNPW